MLPGAELVVKGKVEDGITMRERERERKETVQKELERRKSE